MIREQNNEKLDILVFGAHPDDAEIGMGGTIAKHVAAGLRVGMCDLTEAEMSSNGTVESRRREAAEASSVLGLAVRTNLGLPDRGLGADGHIEAITAEIRRWRPRLVFAPYWNDRHPDHNRCSALVEEAVFNAKLRRYMPELQAIAVEQLYFYYINDVEDVRLAVDVSDVYDRKLASLRAYRSQFESVKGGEDRVATPLTGRYVDNVEARDRLLGTARGWTYAEGFTMKKPHTVELF
ncbi:bacillithiol biosynthesis deacetylase BshB1 [Paenibacillus xylaniclasticus]|uniref:bacillithiol biosynthesis deacetylase BshB1 n=1 Tax=Paenibacillus xylaniclasticus TaxID=588083 RepID=UPI000FDA3CC0|nr:MULTISPECIES: bacillithiol biosynthesis deacetylase BshB1 [Paenibacillus]GFN30679.1 bacillithiol biosynthesis deacetylase BshB1 [Paenibacillus curdlanolyticus]